MWPNKPITCNMIYKDSMISSKKDKDYYRVIIGDSNLRKLHEFKDKLLDNSTWSRSIGNYIINFNEHNKITHWCYKFELKSLKPTRTTTQLNKRFLTLDIECWINEDGFHTPFAIGFFDGNNVQIEYSEGVNDNTLLSRFFVSMTSSHPESIVFVHNLAGYDIHFMLKVLDSLFHLEFIRHDGDIISVACYDPKYRGEVKV